MNQKTRKRYTHEFKVQAVELLSTGKSVSQVAEELCVAQTHSLDRLPKIFTETDGF